MVNKKSLYRKIIFATVAFAALAGAALAFVFGGESKAYAEEESVTYYGRDILVAEAMQGDSRLLNAYDAVADGAGKKLTTIELSTYNITAEELDKVMTFYRNDYAEHYWFPAGYKALSSGGKVARLEIEYQQDFDDAEFAAQTENILSCINGKTTDYDKALAIHDALAESVTYDLTAPNAHSAYGAIVDKRAVCEGYAEAYQYLLRRAGLQSYLVTGESRGEGHEWNLVRLNGKYYYVDVTWDDPVSNKEEVNKPIYHAYFAVPSQIIEEDHVADDAYSVLPVCTDTDMMYKGMTVLESYTVDGVGGAFVSDGEATCVADLFFSGTQDNFSAWLNENLNAVIAKTPFNGKGIDISASSLGREHIVRLTLKDCAHAYDSPVWSWTGYSSVQAKFVCSKCKNAVGVDGEITSKITVNPTEENAGEEVYTATVSFGGETYTDVKTKILPATSGGAAGGAPTQGNTGSGTGGGDNAGGDGFIGGEECSIIEEKSGLFGCVNPSVELPGMGITLGAGLLVFAAVITARKIKKNRV